MKKLCPFEVGPAEQIFPTDRTNIWPTGQIDGRPAKQIADRQIKVADRPFLLADDLPEHSAD